MSNFIVVVFPNERAAYRGSRALEELHAEGSVAIHGHAIIHRDAAGVATLDQKDEEGPVGLVVGSAIGSLVGLLGGPAGAALGLAGGALLGGGRDLFKSRLSERLRESVQRHLAPGQYAIIAEVSDENRIPIEMRMKDAGGTLVREWREDLSEETRVAAAKEAEPAELRVGSSRAPVSS